MTNQRNWRDGLNMRQIADIWLALQTTGIIFLIVSLVGAFGAILVSLVQYGKFNLPIITLGILLAWVISSVFIFRVLRTYMEGIVIDPDHNEVSFPATDIETTLVAILTLKRFFAHGRREMLRLSSIEGIFNETRIRRDHYAVNITGSFGSRQLVFYSKQKRDEFLSAMAWAAKQSGCQFRCDRNIDTGVYNG